MPCGDGGGIHSWHIQGTVRGSVYLWWSKLWWVKGSSRVRSDGLLIQSFVGHCKGFRFYPEWFGKFWPNCMYPLLTCSFTQSCFWNLSILICVAMVDSFSLLYIFIALYYRVLFALLSLKDSFSFFCPHVYMSLSVCSCMGEEVGISQHLQCHTEIICGWIKRWRARLSCLSCGQLNLSAGQSYAVQSSGHKHSEGICESWNLLRYTVWAHVWFLACINGGQWTNLFGPISKWSIKPTFSLFQV